LPDEVEHCFALARMLLFDLDKLSSHMRPAVGLCEFSALFLQRIVRCVAVGERNACVVTEDLFCGFSAATALKAVVHGIRAANGPRLPALSFPALLLTQLTHELPVSFVDSDHRLSKDIFFETLVGRLQKCG